jgi:hypothetical protein
MVDDATERIRPVVEVDSVKVTGRGVGDVVRGRSPHDPTVPIHDDQFNCVGGRTGPRYLCREPVDLRERIRCRSVQADRSGLPRWRC